MSKYNMYMHRNVPSTAKLFWKVLHALYTQLSLYKTCQACIVWTTEVKTAGNGQTTSTIQKCVRAICISHIIYFWAVR